MALLSERTISKRQLKKPTYFSPHMTTAASAEEVESCKKSCAESFPLSLRQNDVRAQREYRACMQSCSSIRYTPEQPESGEEAPGCPPESRGAKAYEGCSCGSRFSVPSADFQCPPGYRMVMGTAGPSCRCEKWCADGLEKGTLSEACTGTGGGAGEGVGGEFQWSPEVKALIARILERAQMLLDRPLGLSDEERQAIYNRVFEKIKGGERASIQSEMDRTSRMGLLGSPYAERGITGIQRGTRELLAGTERDIEIEETQRRFDELMQTTQLSNLLLGTGMGAEQISEVLSAARRGEGMEAFNLVMQYLAMLYGGQNQSYWQALMNRWLQGENE